MDIFKYLNPTDDMKMEQGQIINNLSSKTWIERYAEAGEFTLIANVESNIRSVLPIGTFISHVNSTEIMIVEDHQISEERGSPADIVVTGRGLETIFSQRVVGSNKSFPTSTGVTDYVIPSNEFWDQAVYLLNHHLYPVYLTDDNDAIPYLEIMTTVPAGATAAARSVKHGDLYSKLQEILADGSLGIQIIRPGSFSISADPDNVCVVIHKGVDRRNQVAFSHATGEIERADYLWTKRKLKNAALIQGRWVETRVVGTETGKDRRWMIVDASDIDQALTEAPSGGTLTSIVSKMQQRGSAALRAQKDIALTKAEVSKQSLKARYREDYYLGDLISVEGNYNEDSVRRVTEYVEIEDKTGRVAYPTLSEP